MNYPVAAMARVRPGMLDQYRQLCAPPPGVVKAINTGHFRNAAVYFKKIANPGRLLLFNHVEYHGSDFPADLTCLGNRKNYVQWRKDCERCLVAASASGSVWEDLEPLFFTPGAADVASVPAAYVRLAMITGLKPEKEMEYRALHATVWPAVLKSIKDRNIRNFSIHLGDIGGKLYLFGYWEYVGTDLPTDEAKAAALAVNRRWWKLTDACLAPLPDAVAAKRIWSPMDEVYYHE